MKGTKKKTKKNNKTKILFFSLYIEGVNKMLKKTTTPKPPKKTLYITCRCLARHYSIYHGISIPEWYPILPLLLTDTLIN